MGSAMREGEGAGSVNQEGRIVGEIREGKTGDERKITRSGVDTGRAKRIGETGVVDGKGRDDRLNSTG